MGGPPGGPACEWLCSLSVSGRLQGTSDSISQPFLAGPWPVSCCHSPQGQQTWNSAVTAWSLIKWSLEVSLAGGAPSNLQPDGEEIASGRRWPVYFVRPAITSLWKCLVGSNEAVSGNSSHVSPNPLTAVRQGGRLPGLGLGSCGQVHGAPPILPQVPPLHLPVHMGAPSLIPDHLLPSTLFVGP